MDILYEDNHIIIVNKEAGEIVQGDKTGDVPLSDKIKAFIKERDHKPGNVFLGVVHRLDRPVSGVVLFAKTSKGLSRMNALFREDKVEKVYHALVETEPNRPEATLRHFLKKNQSQNKSYPVASKTAGAKEAVLTYKLIGRSDRYYLLEVRLQTGRHHQIRAQLAANGTIIKGDLKYGAKRSNPDASISLHARRIKFVHPVSKEVIDVTAPYPENSTLWLAFK